MIVDQINNLKKKLESQISKNDSYEKIYETSVMLDDLIVSYYKEFEKVKEDSNC